MATPSKGEQAKKFAAYFRTEIEHIADLQSDAPSLELFKKALYVCVLDTLAKPVYPRRGNRERFTSFVERFGGWKYGARVSLSHLVELLRRSPEPEFEDLRLMVAQQFTAWPVRSSAIVMLESDPEFSVVRAKWPAGHDDKALRAIQHFSLLYSYRTFLVHEMREPGQGWNFAGHEHPHYHLLSKLSSVGEIEISSVELVYPLAFIKQLCVNGVNAFEQYMAKNELNPYDYFGFGTYWLTEWND